MEIEILKKSVERFWQTVDFGSALPDGVKIQTCVVTGDGASAVLGDGSPSIVEKGRAVRMMIEKGQPDGDHALTLVLTLSDGQVVAQDLLVRASDVAPVAKGDVPGHEFHGNQYSGGGGVSGYNAPGNEDRLSDERAARRGAKMAESYHQAKQRLDGEIGKLDKDIAKLNDKIAALDVTIAEKKAAIERLGNPRERIKELKAKLALVRSGGITPEMQARIDAKLREAGIEKAARSSGSLDADLRDLDRKMKAIEEAISILDSAETLMKAPPPWVEDVAIWENAVADLAGQEGHSIGDVARRYGELGGRKRSDAAKPTEKASSRAYTGHFAQPHNAAAVEAFQVRAYGSGPDDKRVWRAATAGLPVAKCPDCDPNGQGERRDVAVKELALSRNALSRGKLTRTARALADGVREGDGVDAIKVAELHAGDGEGPRYAVLPGEGNHRVAHLMLSRKAGTVPVMVMPPKVPAKPAAKQLSTSTPGHGAEFVPIDMDARRKKVRERIAGKRKLLTGNR